MFEYFYTTFFQEKTLQQAKLTFAVQVFEHFEMGLLSPRKARDRLGGGDVSPDAGVYWALSSQPTHGWSFCLLCCHFGRVCVFVLKVLAAHNFVSSMADRLYWTAVFIPAIFLPSECLSNWESVPQHFERGRRLYIWLYPWMACPNL